MLRRMKDQFDTTKYSGTTTHTFEEMRKKRKKRKKKEKKKRGRIED